MYRVTSILVLFAVIGMLVPVAASPPLANARVWVSSQSPLEVGGSGFKPSERVTVTVVVSTGDRFEQAVTATNTGSLVARWADAKIGSRPCTSTFVKAAGDRGSTAAWRSVAEDCADGPTP